MAKSFEEMAMWKGSRDLVKFVYQITKNKDFCTDFSLTDQIRRAAVSVMSNIAETQVCAIRLSEVLLSAGTRGGR